MKEIIKLPPPKLRGTISIEEAISKRRSVRSYIDKELTLEQISQVLWSAQGITDDRRNFRAVPSAGATFPMEIYIVTRNGLFHYNPFEHSIEKKIDKDIRKELADACWGQNFIADAGLTLIIVAVYERTTSYYGQRGIRYVDMEAGHIAQNLHLQAISLGLDSVAIGAFNDDAVKNLLKLPKEQKPIYIIPIGYKR